MIPWRSDHPGAAAKPARAIANHEAAVVGLPFEGDIKARSTQRRAAARVPPAAVWREGRLDELGLWLATVPDRTPIYNCISDRLLPS